MMSMSKPRGVAARGASSDVRVEYRSWSGSPQANQAFHTSGFDELTPDLSGNGKTLTCPYVASAVYVRFRTDLQQNNNSIVFSHT